MKNRVKNNIQIRYQNNKKSIVISKKKDSLFLPYIIVFCLPVLLYIQTIKFGFTGFDDEMIISNNINFLKDFSNAHHAFLTDAFIDKSSSFYRPLQSFSYMLNIKLSGGNNPWMYHLSNVLLLGFVACLLFLFLKKFLIPSKLALLSTLIYVTHPLFVSSVAWIPALGELQLMLFSLLSFLFFIEFIKNGKLKYLIFNWIVFTMALFSKETAVLLPFLFVIYYLTFSSHKHFEKKYILMILLYSISGIFWLWLRSKSIGVDSIQGDTFGLIPFISNLQVIPESLANFFTPYSIAPIPEYSILKTFIGLVIILIIIILFFKKSERSKKEKIFCISWFLILMFPPMLYKQVWIDYLNHRFFIPLIGILLFGLFVFPKKWIEKSETLISWICIAFIIFLISITFIKSRSYTDPMTYFNSAIIQNPNSSIAYYNRGYNKSSKNDYQGAIDDYSKAITIYPEYAEAYNNRGNMKNVMSDIEGAIDDYNKAIAINPSYEQAYYNRGVVKLNINNNSGAIEDFSKAITINPNNINAYINRSVAEYLTKDLINALTDCNKVLELNPDYEKYKSFKNKIQQELQMTNK